MPIVPAAFKKLDAIAVLAGFTLPVPGTPTQVSKTGHHSPGLVATRLTGRGSHLPSGR
jgi:hypothetical protein